jgi:hypothetical protein
MKSRIIYILSKVVLFSYLIQWVIVLVGSPGNPEKYKPDLSVSHLTVDPARLVLGENITLIYIIKNDGKADVIKKNINYSVYISSNHLFDPEDLRILSIDEQGFTLKSGKTTSKKKFVFQLPAVDKLKGVKGFLSNQVLYLIFMVDRKNIIRESREDNNFKYALIYLLR